jgi:hypothetical protein
MSCSYYTEIVDVNKKAWMFEGKNTVEGRESDLRERPSPSAWRETLIKRI